MGQYYVIANVSKKEMLVPWSAKDGAKLLEWGLSRFGVQLMWTLLCADGNDRGGGDFHPDDDTPHQELIGSWVGDVVFATGDYADPIVDAPYFSKVDWDPSPEPKQNLYHYACAHFSNITPLMLDMFNKSHIRKEEQRVNRDYWHGCVRREFIRDLWPVFCDLLASINAGKTVNPRKIEKFVRGLYEPRKMVGHSFTIAEITCSRLLPEGGLQ